ncbi:tetratricopeptide repeat-containing sensor histidine kinase [Hymenobacter ruricola]|uniref:Oxygen sensor histidine kinase NreB n=1 Tax=Hymenobacter ruricola TaxID=2791023 RepID=A0ABS0I9C3_9BACT|nr:sensor histidine kinase [Hymenobacter ruricola]MBF9223553.1 sensor histidine kinase [Hymenobacter ruricola]
MRFSSSGGRFLLQVGLGLGGLWLGAAPPACAQTVATSSLADSLNRRRAAAPDTAQLRLLLADANVLRTAEPAEAKRLATLVVQRAGAGHPAPQQAALLLLGRMANAEGDFPAAAESLLQALRLAEQRHDLLGQGSACLGLATTNKNLQKFDQSLEYARRAQALLSQAVQAGDARAAKPLAIAFNNSGTALMGQNRLAAARADFQISLQKARALGDSSVAVLALYNLGGLALRQKHGAEAHRYYRQTLAIDQAEGNEQGQAESWLNLGDALALLHRTAEAEAAYQQALQISRRLHALPIVRVVYNGFASLYEDNGQPAKALQWQRRFQLLNDSLFQEQSTQQVAELQTKYDTEKKDAQNRLQASQLREQQQLIRRRTTLLWAGGLVALLLAGLAYLLVSRRRLRREMEFTQERQQLERLRAAAVLEAEEAERRRIGSDLHDGVGQLLTAAKLNLHALSEELGVPTVGQQAMLQNALDGVEDSFREVRSISHNLMPNALIKRGLAQAVRDFLDKVTPDGRLKINLEVVGLDRGGRLEPTVENVLFRVIQELVQNILKHARATEVTLQIIRHAEELTVLVEDNGVGFDPAALGPDAGIGLKNIESRMAYLGGRANFDATPGHGTSVTLEMPLTNALVG